MTNNIGYESLMAIPPGETIQEMLDTKGLSQREFALRMGLTPKHVNNIIKGSAPITYETALKLETVLGISARFWNNLELDYQETLARIEALPKIQEEVKILQEINYTELVKHGWIAAATNLSDKIENLRRYFKVARLDSLQEVHQALFRKSQSKEADFYSLAAWLVQGETKALELSVEPYNKDALKKALTEIRRLTLRPLKSCKDDLQEICARSGIAFVLVSHLPKTYVNGATKWLPDDRVMIEMSTRGVYEDIFWFSFFHEIAHVLEHKKSMVFIDDDTNQNDDLEKEANEFASEILIPQKEYRKLVETEDYKDRVKLRNFSDYLGIQIGIVVGRLMKDRYISFDDRSFGGLRRKTTILSGD